MLYFPLFIPLVGHLWKKLEAEKLQPTVSKCEGSYYVDLEDASQIIYYIIFYCGCIYMKDVSVIYI